MNILKSGFVSRTGCAALMLFTACGNARARDCDRPQDVTAVRTAALQQEMMVAGFVCHDVAAYNRFVMSHRGELQNSDRALMSFFVQQDAQSGTGDYNLYKTELANAASLRSTRDRYFCSRVNADFTAALGHNMPLEQLLLQMPYPVSTGSVRCTPDWEPAPLPTGTTAKARGHRTWLGALLHDIFD